MTSIDHCSFAQARPYINSNWHLLVTSAAIFDINLSALKSSLWCCLPKVFYFSPSRNWEQIVNLCPQPNAGHRKEIKETLRNVTFYRCVNDWQNFWTSNSLQVEWRLPARVTKPQRGRKLLPMSTRPSQPCSQTTDTPKAKHRMSNFLFLTAQVRKM